MEVINCIQLRNSSIPRCQVLKAHWWNTDLFGSPGDSFSPMFISENREEYGKFNFSLFIKTYLIPV